MLSVDVFGLGQITVPATTQVSAPIPSPDTFPKSTLVVPAFPDDVAIKCHFDPAIEAWRCGQTDIWERPGTYGLIAAGFALLSVGFVLGNVFSFDRIGRIIEKRAI